MSEERESTLNLSNDTDTTIEDTHVNREEVTTQNDVAEVAPPDEGLRRSGRSGAGEGVTRFKPDIGGTQYFDQRKVYKQFLQRKRLERSKKNVIISLTMKKLNAKKRCQFFQIAVNKIFLSAQMNAKQGIKLFGERAVAAMIKEFCQLNQGAFPGKPVVEPIDPNTLTAEEMEMVMEAISLIKEKRDGTMKGRTCADGSKQRKYLKPDESVASPTVSTEGLLSTFVIDAYEDRHVAVLDIPGAYLHTGMPDHKRVVMRLRGQFVDLMCEANPKYIEFVRYERGQKVLYLQVLQAIYGCIESAMLWYKLFTDTLSKMGFKVNPYDKCVANKVIGGKQCTIVWYVDDVKISHCEESVVRNIIKQIENEFGDMKPTHGKVHDYLGMRITITEDKKISIDMRDQIQEIIADYGEEIDSVVSTPAARHLMMVDDKVEKLSTKMHERFHSLTAKLLYLEKRARPDIETAVAFLTTRVSKPDVDDWKKLVRVITYLNSTIDVIRTIGCTDLTQLHTWIDAAFAIHPNMRSHTGGVMSLGHGVIHAKSSKGLCMYQRKKN